MKLFNENGECEIYVEVKCIQGCLLETFTDVWPASNKVNILKIRHLYNYQPRYYKWCMLCRITSPVSVL